MIDDPTSLYHLLFALTLALAFLAVLLDVYAEVVLAIGIFILFWLFVQLLGPRPLLVVIVIFAAAVAKVTVDAGRALLAGEDGHQTTVSLLDEVLTDHDDPLDRTRRDRIWSDQDGSRPPDDDDGEQR